MQFFNLDVLDEEALAIFMTKHNFCHDERPLLRRTA